MFSRVAVPFYIPGMYKSSSISAFSPTLGIFIKKKKAFLIGVKEYLKMSLIIMLSIFSHAYLKTMYFLWCSVCTNICPFLLIFYWRVVESLWIFFVHSGCRYSLYIQIHDLQISPLFVTGLFIFLTIFYKTKF